MGRLGKLFGKKSEPIKQPKATQGELGGVAKIPKTAPSEVESSHKAPSGQDFGVQFVFDSGETRFFKSLPVFLGRSKQNDIVIEDETVSAEHAQVYFDEQAGGVCIQDLDSLNGVFIDGQPTRKSVLLDGVKIRLGNVTLTFRDTGYIHPGSNS